LENQQKPRKLIVSDARDEDSKRDPDQELRKTAPKDQILSQKQKIRTKRTKISFFWVCFSCFLIYFFLLVWICVGVGGGFGLGLGHMVMAYYSVKEEGA
jgi:hypothetical protein